MKQSFVEIHKALHDPNVKEITVEGQRLVITEKGRQKMRYVIFKDSDGKQWEVIQQNIESGSVYGARARRGEQISWRIPMEYGFRITYKGWSVITNDTIADGK